MTVATDKAEALKQIKEARKALTQLKAAVLRAEAFIDQFDEDNPEHPAILNDESCHMTGSFDAALLRINAVEKTVQAID